MGSVHEMAHERKVSYVLSEFIITDLIFPDHELFMDGVHKEVAPK